MERGSQLSVVVAPAAVDLEAANTGAAGPVRWMHEARTAGENDGALIDPPGSKCRCVFLVVAERAQSLRARHVAPRCVQAQLEAEAVGDISEVRNAVRELFS